MFYDMLMFIGTLTVQLLGTPKKKKKRTIKQNKTLKNEAVFLLLKANSSKVLSSTALGSYVGVIVERFKNWKV